MIKSGVSSKTVSEFLNISVSSIYYQPKNKDEDKIFYSLIKQIANSFPFYGYRRIHRTLRSSGYQINHKRVYRIYKELNLQKVKFKKKKKIVISNNNSITIPKYPNHIWSIDFAFDEIENGKRIKIMPVYDIFSRFCISIKADYSICAESMIKTLEKCFSQYGKPEIIRTDNGPEFRSKKFTSFLAKNRVKQEFIAKGSPWENGNIESFIGKLREECLNMHVFNDINIANETIGKFRHFYNTSRPHSSIGGRYPYEYYFKIAI
jgi:putative transposase